MTTQEVKAHAVSVMGSPQKMRLVADMVRGKAATQAVDLLRFLPNTAARHVSKVIKSAMANAEENFGMNSEDLVIKTITVDEGRSLKRRRFASRGRSVIRRKRSSHISVVLVEGTN